MMTDKYVGPTWDLTEVYESESDPEIHKDLHTIEARLADAAHLANVYSQTGLVSTIQDLFRCIDAIATKLYTIRVFVQCHLSVDGTNEVALKLMGQIESLKSRLLVQRVVCDEFIETASDTDVQSFLAPADLSVHAYQVGRARSRADRRLSNREEALLSRMASNGIEAWGRLYTQLSGTIRCPIDTESGSTTLGLAEAAGLMADGSDSIRRKAWLGINQGWSTNKESCAAILNALSGWRLQEGVARAKGSGRGFLEDPLFASKISEATLNALMGAARDRVSVGQRAAKLQARAYGKEKFSPWDLRAPAPQISKESDGEKIPFEEALTKIADAYGSVHPEMGAFVEMMGARKWIDASSGPNKRPGAYCTSLRSLRQPRVYMTYTGAPSQVITLAHELGHAYHNWVMRDLPLSQTAYGMSLAETASTFGESLVRDELLRHSKSKQERLNMLWAEMSAFTGFTLNIPVRFSFEKRFYELRNERSLRPSELNELMSAAWTEWYGDALSEPDPWFWASKLHFSMSYLSFYNFPYLFGYLFSLGVYYKREEMGDAFFDRYVALLRDTGRTSAEELALKHLGVDISTPTFWNDVLSKLEQRVDVFEGCLEELGL